MSARCRSRAWEHGHRVHVLLITLFREGLEASSLWRRSRVPGRKSKRALSRGRLKGVGAAVIATVAVFILATAVIRLAPLQPSLSKPERRSWRRRLFYISFWLFHASSTQVDGVPQRQGLGCGRDGLELGAGRVGFTAVFRRASRQRSSTRPFCSSRTDSSSGRLGCCRCGSSSHRHRVAIFRAGRKIPARQFLAIASAWS